MDLYKAALRFNIQLPHECASFNKLLTKPFLAVHCLPQFKGRASSWGCNIKAWATAAAPGLDLGEEGEKPLCSPSRDLACTGATSASWAFLHAAGTCVTLLQLLPPSAAFQRAVPACNVWWERDLWLADIWLCARQRGNWNYWNLKKFRCILFSSAFRPKETELDKTSILTICSPISVYL